MVLSPDVTVCEVANKGKGIIATRDIAAGEKVWWWNEDAEPAYEYSKSDIEKETGDFGDKLRMYSFMVGENTFSSISRDPDEAMCPSFYFNHSCVPSCWFDEGGNCLVTVRAVAAGEELNYDYATTESESSFHVGMRCNCDSEHCRGVLTGSEYSGHEFFSKYKGHMMEYLERIISRRVSGLF
mmetsp:Transcript_2277/g.3382  ORF Transcript_2277/g.3382 Transcript_2277/m.3382 type:complete len:183 (+) Transcript_2277:172-720(+)|eukprot:CAMPEP_0194569210 /NCGR_PEP_ID=MMETSP0292-20121207/7016_1 /TAXON_ID=39354 /ORGANISM="Heterosigma akashiwo, Strain CCMP2393" /LENGTH=182 /DNA_ID=CAMNT_0039419413 /DNA_START=152 /DNA_END=700 /DNA_ORIENTATION=-